MKDYIVVQATDKVKFTKVVNDCLEVGYKLAGGLNYILVKQTDGSFLHMYTQAVYLDK
ncbi:MAG: DUF1737 domain-containing protein [Bacteroidetes bacterium]|nr:DUF1737 domain-containing protein [Bacteroidota bacterium]